MSNTCRRPYKAAVVAALLLWNGLALAADTDPVEIPEGVLAKMARINAKQNVDRGGIDRDEDGSAGRSRGANSACGSLNVGNVDMGKRRIGAPVREVTVVIRGDVINANNKCR